MEQQRGAGRQIGRRGFVGLSIPIACALCGATRAFADSGDTVRADPNAKLTFDRSSVSSIPAGNHSGTVMVASADLPRPVKGQLYAPLEALVPTSPFGYRINPLTGLPGEFHWGQDFGAGEGTRVYAADAGVVQAAGWHPWGGGNRVEVNHGNGLVTTYNHMHACAVKAGDSVQPSQVVGLVGHTGSATGSHLHFETHLNGVYEDPMKWTFIGIKQTDPVANLTLTDYTPKDGQTPASQNWSVPTTLDEPAPGETIQKAPAPTPTAPGPAASPSPQSSSTASSSGASSGGGSASNSASSPSSTSTSSSPAPSPTADPTPTPSPTPSRTPSSSPTPSPTATATVSSSPATSATAPTTATPTATATATPTPTP
ncbi:M23 family metallopeptidase [Sinomonas susongensis]|uniref:M23 family metallopeptidase n=1 Tax=Sinomonas susongensis TaxID=1324851 RepID=UPI001109B1AB|nr:M23 family metallopeptidase [Sinomonas susongensis]